MQYRLTPKPGLIKVNRSISIKGLAINPARNGVISPKSSSVSTPALKHAPPRVSSPKANAPAPVPGPIKSPAAPPAQVIQSTKVIQPGKNQKVFKRNRNKHSINLEHRSGIVVKDRYHDNLQKYADKIKSLKDIGFGRILVMIACGPSILEVELGKLKDNPKIDMMCINKPDKRVWPTKYWAFCDYSQYKRNQDAWDSYRGLIINSSAVKARHPSQILIKNLGGKGFSRDMLKGYYIGRSSTYANMQLALWMGYEVYIFGLDMCEVNGMTHFYGQNPDVQNENRHKRFAIEAEHYLHAADDMTDVERNKFTICSNYNPWPFADRFKRLDHNTAVDHILDRASKLS